jgi:hypothetical protein
LTLLTCKLPADNPPGSTSGIRGQTLIRRRQSTFEKFRRYVNRVSAAGKPVKNFYSTFHFSAIGLTPIRHKSNDDHT